MLALTYCVARGWTGHRIPDPASPPDADPPGRQNSFDLLRLVAAVMVLISHSFPLVGEAEPELAGVSLGGFGVIVFFAISGYLVTRSWAYDQRLTAFAAKRGLRLLPALAVCVLVTAYVIGPVATMVSGSFPNASWSNSVASVGAARSSGAEAPRHARSSPLSTRFSSSWAAGRPRSSGTLPKVTDTPRTPSLPEP